MPFEYSIKKKRGGGKEQERLKISKDFLKKYLPNFKRRKIHTITTALIVITVIQFSFFLSLSLNQSSFKKKSIRKSNNHYKNKQTNLI